MGRRQARPVLVEEHQSAGGIRNQQPLFDQAYERIEALIVTCTLRPGQFLSIHELQETTGLSRTPVHQAVKRLADDTLIIVRPRHGLQIAPIDLTRERLLLKLRRDMERFVVSLAAERSGASHRNRMLHLARALRERGDGMGIGEFNEFDRRIDRLILSAAAEPFLEHTLRPLHTIYRRIGWLHHAHIAGEATLRKTIDCHLAVLEGVANKHRERAVAASDALIAFVDEMFDVMELQIDPAVLDASFMPLDRTWKS